MPTPPSIAQGLAHFFCPLTYEDLSEDLVRQIKAFFLDWVGSAVAGYGQAPVQMMLSLADEMKGSQEATIIPTMCRHLPLIAALVNGGSCHVVEMDDLHRESIFHPAAPILPAVFAAGEKAHVTGRVLILGILAGYEVGIRAALAAGRSHYERWHTTATCGTFGAAAGAAKILGLGPEPFVWALGSAGTQSSGLWEFLVEGAMSKQLHTGKAALNGLLAALLAQKGFTGASGIFEGEKAFLKATSDDYDAHILTEGLGKTFYTARNSLKFHASCGHTHSAVDAALKVREEINANITAIRSVSVSVYKGALDLLGDVEAETPYLAKFNLPFCVATALRFGHVDPDDFSKERLGHPDIVHLMDIISLKEDPELTRLYPRKWPAQIAVELLDGTISTGYCEYPKGDPENPLSERELIKKFKKLCRGGLPMDQQERIIDVVLRLEEIDDVTKLFHVE